MSISVVIEGLLKILCLKRFLSLSLFFSRLSLNTKTIEQGNKRRAIRQYNEKYFSRTFARKCQTSEPLFFLIQESMTLPVLTFVPLRHPLLPHPPLAFAFNPLRLSSKSNDLKKRVSRQKKKKVTYLPRHGVRHLKLKR